MFAGVHKLDTFTLKTARLFFFALHFLKGKKHPFTGLNTRGLCDPMLDLPKYFWVKIALPFKLTGLYHCVWVSTRTSELLSSIKLFFFLKRVSSIKINPSMCICVSRSSLSFRFPRVVDALKLEVIDFRMSCHQCPHAATNYIWSILVIRL